MENNKNWVFRRMFVKIEKEALFATVTNDNYYVDMIRIKSKTEEAFKDECREYLDSDRFKEKLKQQRGY